MAKVDLTDLKRKALDVLKSRNRGSDVKLSSVTAGSLPRTDKPIFKFVAETRDTNDEGRKDHGSGASLPAIVLDSGGNIIDPDRYPHLDPDFIDDPGVFPTSIKSEHIQDIAITPSVNELELRPGEVQEERLVVSIPRIQEQKKVDIYFVSDVTGSMESVVNNVRLAAADILNGISLGLDDVFFGVGSYTDLLFGTRVRDENGNFIRLENGRDLVEYTEVGSSAFESHQALTGDSAIVRAAFSQWVIQHRSADDWSEAQLYALDRIAEDQGGEIGWREDSQKFVVWMGDISGHEPICARISPSGEVINLKGLIEKLRVKWIHVLALSLVREGVISGLDVDARSVTYSYREAGLCFESGAPPGQASRIAHETTGAIIEQLNTDPVLTTIIDLVGPALRKNYVQLEAMDAATDFLSPEDISPREGYAVTAIAAHEVVFVVKFRGTIACKRRESQFFEGPVRVILNEEDAKNKKNKLVEKTLKVTVPPCERCEVKGSPSAAVSVHNLGGNHTNKFNVAIRGPSDDYGDMIWLCSNDGDPTDSRSWNWHPIPQPSGTKLIETPLVVASNQPTTNPDHELLDVFSLGPNGDVYRYRYDELVWSGIGKPHGRAEIVDRLSAVTYRTTRTYETGLFGWGGDEQVGEADDGIYLAARGYPIASLFVHDENWRHLGTAPGLVEIAQASAIARDTYYLYAFAIGVDGRLYVCHSTNLTADAWSWANLGMPRTDIGLTPWLGLGVGRLEFGGSERFYIFAKSTDGNLWVRDWLLNSATGQQEGGWELLSRPSGHSIRSQPSVVTHSSNGRGQIYAFTRGNDGHLLVSFWNAHAAAWQWRNLGRPANAQLRGDPAALADLDGNNIFVFSTGNDGYLHMCLVDPALANPQWMELS